MECLLEETGWASSAAGIKVAKGGHSVSGVNLANLQIHLSVPSLFPPFLLPLIWSCIGCQLYVPLIHSLRAKTLFSEPRTLGEMGSR